MQNKVQIGGGIGSTIVLKKNIQENINISDLNNKISRLTEAYTKIETALKGYGTTSQTPQMKEKLNQNKQDLITAYNKELIIFTKNLEQFAINYVENERGIKNFQKIYLEMMDNRYNKKLDTDIVLQKTIIYGNSESDVKKGFELFFEYIQKFNEISLSSLSS